MNISFPSESSSLPDLSAHWDELASFRTRRAMERSDLFRSLSETITATHQAMTWRNRNKDVPKNGRVRICAWNIERGKQLEGILEVIRRDPMLSETDIWLFTEVDIGMGRTNNVNVAKALADALDMNYVFGAAYIELTGGDVHERLAGHRNTYALHGDVILSRFPIENARLIPIFVPYDKYHHIEKRLGDQKTLLAEINIGGKILACEAIHLEIYSSAKKRACQLSDSLMAFRPGIPAIAGGDFNTGTYDASSRWTIARSLAYKLLVTGFDNAVYHYMTPEKIFEKPVFDMIRSCGFTIDGCNDLSKGTFYYDMNDPALQSKTRTHVPDWVIQWVNRKLEPWKGLAPLKMDWFASRDLMPCGDPVTIERPRWKGQLVSDHNPIVTDVVWP